MTPKRLKDEAWKAVVETREAVEQVRADYHDEDRYQEPGSWQKALDAAKAARDAAVIAYGEACVAEALAPREPSPELAEHLAASERELRFQATNTPGGWENAIAAEMERLREQIRRIDATVNHQANDDGDAMAALNEIRRVLGVPF